MSTRFGRRRRSSLPSVASPSRIEQQQRFRHQAVFGVEPLERRMLLTGLAWSTGPAVPVALGNTAALSTGAGVILFGGATSPGGNTTPSGVHLFDPFGGTWTTVAGSDQGRNGGGVGATGSPGPIISGGGESGYKYTSDIFQFGGANQGHLTASVYNYDTGGRESTNGPALSAARYRLAYATDPATGDLYAIGGLGSSGTALSSVERYDPQADAWSAVASLPQARYAASAASDGAGHILRVEFAQIRDIDPFQHRALALAQEMPRHDVGMMLHDGENDFTARLDARR